MRSTSVLNRVTSYVANAYLEHWSDKQNYQTHYIQINGKYYEWKQLKQHCNVIIRKKWENIGATLSD